MEITKEGVENIKEIHSTLQNLIRNMKPETALAMIRENINPITEDIHTVNAYLTITIKRKNTAAFYIS